jgi:hypothetical protein
MFEFFGGLFINMLNWFGQKLNDLGEFFGGAIGKLGNLIGGLLEKLFQGIVNVLSFLFRPILDVLMGIWFFIQQLFNIVILVIKIIVRLFQIIGELINEVIRAIFGLNYTGSQAYYRLPNAYQSGFLSVVEFLDETGFSKIALIFAFFIWIATAYAVVKIVTRRN